jgi:diguanylate cyclase (GGDEF)-like protein
MPTRARRINVFRGRVGRRVLGMFLLAGVLPMLLLAYLSYAKVDDGLRREIQIGLRETAKSIGMRVVDNLGEISNSAQAIARVAAEEPENLRTVIRASANRFEAIWKIAADGHITLLYGDAITDFDINSLNRHHLSNGRSQLLRVESPAATAWLIAALADRDDEASGIVAFRVSEEAVWAPHEYLPNQIEYCILSHDGRVFYCSGRFGKSSLIPVAELGEDLSPALIEWHSRDAGMVSESWQLFLMGESAFNSVDVVTIVKQERIFGVVREFLATFPLIVALVVVIVAYFSFRIVHKNLVPVRQLKNAALAYASGKLDTRVNIATGDEFEHLGHAFNDMAGNLSRQFDLLRTMSNVDQLIMSFASVEEICEVVLSHLSAQSGGRPCAIILQAESESTQARLLIFKDQHLDTELIVFDPHLTQRIRPDMGDEWYGLQDLAAPLHKHFKDAGFRHFRNVPVSFDNFAHGFVVLGTENKDESFAAVLQHCEDLSQRIAVGVSNAEREQVLYQKTHFDSLTRLPNRQFLQERLEQAISELQDANDCGALLLLDLDHFKKINDLFGHSTGDLILGQAAQRILTEARETYTSARLGDDEFAVVMPSIESADEAAEFAARLQARLAQKFEVNGHDHIIGASIGIAVFPDDGNCYEVLIRNADAALHRVKDAGRGKFEYFSERLNADSQRKLTLERGLRMALEADELRLHYQPQFNLSDGKLHGAEALLRWRHQTLGEISPVEFIPIAEQTDLIIEISNWVLDRVCQDIRHFHDTGIDCKCISINLSGRQLQDYRLASTVGEVLARHDVDPGMIKLEITETAIADNIDVAVQTLTYLRDSGFAIALDDFGTGFSSLSYLAEMPFDYLKIDQSFVRAIGHKKDASNICRAIITMAHELDRTIIAEGLETPEQEAFMREYRVQIGQGYLYSKPLPLEELRRLIELQHKENERRTSLRSSGARLHRLPHLILSDGKS